MALLGPDGKEMPEAPQARKMPTRQEKFNMGWMMFTLMTKEERQQFLKSLRPLRRKLDVLYPNGMDENGIKRELEKAVEEISPADGSEAPSEQKMGEEIRGSVPEKSTPEEVSIPSETEKPSM